MSDAKPQVWFSAHRYGIGWGRPASWQGWGLLMTLPATLLFGAFLPERRLWLVGPLVLISGALIGWGCVAHGERPLRWRRGRQ